MEFPQFWPTWDDRLEQAQEHLQPTAQLTGSARNLVHEQERIASQAMEVPPPGKRGYPDVYVNGEDITVTVDPMKNEAWIRDDQPWRYPASRHRGAIKDHEGVEAVKHLLDNHPPPKTTFIPTSHMLDEAPKFSEFCVSNSTRGHVCRESDGTLPVHHKLIWSGLLDGPMPGVILYDRRPNRAFDCEGMCR